MTTGFLAFLSAVAIVFGLAPTPGTHHSHPYEQVPHAVVQPSVDGQDSSPDRQLITKEANTPLVPIPQAPAEDSQPADDGSSGGGQPAGTPSVPYVPVPAYHPAPAPPPVVVGSTQQALINQDRAAAGLPPLTWNGCLASVAYQNAARMAAQGYISHANGVYQDLACGIGSQSGENVGYWSGGINDYQLNTMFMNSAEHRANIMGPYHYVGTAWVVAKNGYGYIAVEFD